MCCLAPNAGGWKARRATAMAGAMWKCTAVCAAFLGALIASTALAQSWPDAFVRRLLQQALLESLNGELLSHDSATGVLQGWCDERRLAPGRRIIARRVTGPDLAPDPAVLTALAASPGEPIRHRRVELACGGHVLSVADNWYRPARLTAAMNQRLETTQTPFGVAVADLHFHRRTLAVVWLVPLLPPDWRSRGAPPVSDLPPEPPPSALLLQHRVVLADAAGIPFSLVVENYTAEILTETRETPR
jgi:hypothetical protein